MNQTNNHASPGQKIRKIKIDIEYHTNTEFIN